MRQILRTGGLALVLFTAATPEAMGGVYLTAESKVVDARPPTPLPLDFTYHLFLHADGADIGRSFDSWQTILLLSSPFPSGQVTVRSGSSSLGSPVTVNPPVNNSLTNQLTIVADSVSGTFSSSPSLLATINLRYNAPATATFTTVTPSFSLFQDVNGTNPANWIPVPGDGSITVLPEPSVIVGSLLISFTSLSRRSARRTIR